MKDKLKCDNKAEIPCDLSEGHDGHHYSFFAKITWTNGGKAKK